MQIELKDARPGDIVLFKGKGPVFAVLSFILCIFDRQWRALSWKPWHVGFLSSYSAFCGWELCESVRQGVKLTDLTEYDPKTYRIHRWLDNEPSSADVLNFLGTHLGKRYDVAIYFWTALQYLIRHYWNRKIPLLLNDRYTCWENVGEFADEMGKPLCSKYDCILITDFIKNLKVY